MLPPYDLAPAAADPISLDMLVVYQFDFSNFEAIRKKYQLLMIDLLSG